MKWCTYSTVWLLHGWRHTQFLLSQHFLYTLYNHATFCKATYIECMCVCNLPPALLADWPESFSCYCSNTRLEWIPFSHESGALVTELSPLPIPFISISGGRILLYRIQCFEYMYKMQSYFMRQSWNIVICRSMQVDSRCPLACKLLGQAAWGIPHRWGSDEWNCFFLSTSQQENHWRHSQSFSWWFLKGLLFLLLRH